MTAAEVSAARRGLAVGALIITLLVAACGATDGSPARDDSFSTSRSQTNPYSDDVFVPGAAPDGARMHGEAEVGSALEVGAAPDPAFEDDADDFVDGDLERVQRDTFNDSMESINQWNVP